VGRCEVRCWPMSLMAAMGLASPSVISRATLRRHG
jgi:hypothetical protein